MGILFGLGDAQLLESLLRHPLADGIGHVLLIEENVQPRELGVVRGHAAIVERQGVHAGLGHILLRQHNGKLLRAVVAVVEEDYHVVGPDRAHGLAVGVDPHDGLDELVGHVGVIGFLYGGGHVGSMLADAVDQGVVGDLHALPTLVAVHGVIPADDRSDLARRSGQMLLQLLDEALAAARVGIAAVHEAMDERIVDLVLGGDVAQLEKMLQRRVHAPVGRKTHEVDTDAVLLGVLERADDLGILHDRIVAASAVDLYQILVDDAAGADIEVADLRIAHLAVGQADVLAVGAQLRVGIFFGHGRNIIGMNGGNDIRLVMAAVAPAVENHQQNFVCHSRNLLIADP